MIAIVGAIAVIVFMVALTLLRIPQLGRGILQTLGNAHATIRDPSASDLQKEQVAQRSALALWRALLWLILRGTAALAASWLVVWAAEKSGLVPTNSVIPYLSSLEGVALALATSVLAWPLYRWSE